MFAVRASADKTKSKAYFQRLGNAIADQGVTRNFYDFLMTRDLTDRDWFNPPVTSALQSWKTECMPRLDPFIDYFKANNETPCTILSSHLYDKYTEWCETVSEEVLSLRHFGLEMKHISNVEKEHSRDGTIYKI